MINQPKITVAWGLNACHLVAATLGAAPAWASCIDAAESAVDLPYQASTSIGTEVSYSYDLNQEQYLVSWVRGTNSGGPYGPFVLSRACLPATVEWESNEFLLLQAGCGTFCWYALVLPLSTGNLDWRRIERPLAFDQSRNLLAYYPDRRTVMIESLIDAAQQRIRVPQECSSTTELCVRDARFTHDSLELTWHSNAGAEPFSVRLDAGLLQQ